MMKTLLLHPSNINVYKNIKKNVVTLDKESAKIHPLGIMYLAGVLQKNDLDVEILDAEARNMDFEATIETIKNKNPDILGITSTTPLFNTCLEIAEEIKKLNKDIKIVLGGPHITALPKESLAHHAIDFIVIGEGDYSLLELVKAINENRDVKEIKGVGYKKNNQIIMNPRRELIENLDEIPFPARNLIENNRYLNTYTGEVYTLIMTGRGCPYHCIFCGSATTFGHRVRFRSVNNVIREIEEIVNKYKIMELFFADDTFTLNKERTIEICKKIIEKKLDICFICSSRVNTIDEERLKWLKKAGCIMVSFGVESGDDNILKIIKKGITVEQAKKAVALTKKLGIPTHASYMLGNLGENIKTINKTIELAKELDTDFAQFTIATPHPGTELWNIVNSEGLLETRNFSKFSHYYSPVIKLDGVTHEKLKELQQKFYCEYQSGKQGAEFRKKLTLIKNSGNNINE